MASIIILSLESKHNRNTHKSTALIQITFDLIDLFVLETQKRDHSL